MPALGFTTLLGAQDGQHSRQNASELPAGTRKLRGVLGDVGVSQMQDDGQCDGFDQAQAVGLIAFHRGNASPE